MAEKRFHNYKRPLTSFEENERLLGIIHPGRYRGYDTFIPSGLTFTLAHDQTGIEKTKEDLTLTDKTGVLWTKQGVEIHEDEAVGAPFVVGSNAANAFKRIDLVVYEHEFLASPGGQAGIYSIIQGPDGSETEPALTNPEKTIIVGRLEIPASASNLTNAKYTPAPSPAIGNFNHAGQDQWNKFTKVQEWGQCADPITAVENLAVNRSGISVGQEGNLFILDYATTGFEAIVGIRPKPDGAANTIYRNYQPGVIISFIAKQAFAFGDWRTTPITNAKYAEGYREIENPTNDTGTGFWSVFAEEKLMLQLIDTGEADRPHKFRIIAHEGGLYRNTAAISANVATALAYTQPSWVAIATFAAGYVAGTPAPQVKYDFATVGKIVFVRGRMSKSAPVTLSGTTPVHLCTLPAGYFPAIARYIVLHNSAATAGVNNIAQGYVDVDGKVYVIPESILSGGFLAGTDDICLDFNFAL